MATKKTATTEEQETGTTELSKAEKQAIAAAKRKASKKTLTPKQKEAEAKKKEAAKAKAKKEADEEKRVEERKALSSIDVSSKDITAAKTAWNRLEKKNKTLRDDWQTIGNVLKSGRDQCLADTGNLNSRLFSAWKGSKGLSVIPARIASECIWMSSVWDELVSWEQSCIDARDLFYTENPQGDYKGVDPSSTHFPGALHSMAKKDNQPWAFPNNELPEATEGEEADNVEKLDKEFDAIKYADNLKSVIIERFEQGSNFDYLVAKIKEAFDIIQDVQLDEEDDQMELANVG